MTDKAWEDKTWADFGIDWLPADNSEAARISRAGTLGQNQPTGPRIAKSVMGGSGDPEKGS